MCTPCAAATAAIESMGVSAGARLPSRPCAAGVAPVCSASLVRVRVTVRVRVRVRVGVSVSVRIRVRVRVRVALYSPVGQRVGRQLGAHLQHVAARAVEAAHVVGGGAEDGAQDPIRHVQP
eukprot:scaffold33744_cov59-Phaeocystis_antarctica.AAC.2